MPLVNEPGHLQQTTAIEDRIPVTANAESDGRSVRLGLFAGAFCVAMTAGAQTAGINMGELMQSLPSFNGITPDVPVFDEITRGMGTAAEALRDVAPVVVAGTGAAMAALHIRHRDDRQWARMRSMARVSDYSGSDTVSGSTESATKRASGRLRRALAGTALAATAIVTVTAGIEHEVSHGPTRAINQTVRLLSPSDSEPALFVQNQGAMFMNNSYVPRQPANSFIESAAEQGISARPFNRELVDLRSGRGNNSRTALVVGMPTQDFNAMIGRQTESGSDCSVMPVIADEASNTDIGDRITLNDQPAVVAGKTSNASSMNRIGIVAAEADVAACIQENPEAPYYGLVVSGDADKATELLASHELGQNGVLLSSDQLKDNNKKFWQANGTPILLQMMGYVLGFGYIANRNERRASLEHNRKELGMLQAMGVRVKQLAVVENLRAVRETTIATAAAVPVAAVFSAAVNAAEHGLKVGITGTEIAIGFTMTLAAKLFGARRALSRITKSSTPAESMQG